MKKGNRHILHVFYYLMLLVAFFALTCVFASAKTVEVTGYDDDWNSKTIYINGNDSFEFTGSKITPELKIYYLNGSQKVYLTKDKDYTVKSYDSVYPDSYNYVEIESTDASPYDFRCDFDYSIYCTKSKFHVDDITAKTFTGKDIKPAVKVYYGDTLLSSDFYNVYYDDNYDAGTATAEVDFGYDFDYFSIEKSFTIKPASVSKITINDIPAVTYNGDEHEPVPKMTYGGITLDEYDDYSISYKNNINAGTATATIKFKGNFSGSKTMNFTINKASASKVSVSSISTKDYTGKAVKPYVYAYMGWVDFEEGKDYTVSYSNNVKPGTATVSLKFINKNISGTKKVTFKIAVAEIWGFSGSMSNNVVSLRWYEDYSNYSYKIYKYDSAKKEYIAIKSTKSESYNDKDIKELSTYKYKIRAYVTIDGKNYYGPYSSVSVKTTIFAPKTVKLTTKKDSVTVEWSKNTKATGYYVYRYDCTNGKTKKVYTATKNTVVKYVDKSVVNYRPYIYYVVAYKTDNGKTTNGCCSAEISSLSPESISRGVTLKSRTSYKVYNIQEKTTTLYKTVTLSSSDISTLKKFASNHFKSGMTAYEKVEITLNWIHSQVTYASSSDNWNKIKNKTYVDAIFNYKLGQCAQYNGALAGMMTYLGYDVQMFKGHRQSGGGTGAKYQHFWTEVKLNGLTYVMECGNKKDGSWHYFFEPYNNTMGYTKNGKYISGR